MSKDFDTTLSDALDLAAQAALTTGPTAARIRGRKRTVHQRIALTTVSLVLVAVGATTAFVVTSSNGGGSPHLTGGSPHASASVSVTTGPTTSPSTSPSTSPTTGATGTSSPSTSSPASSSSSSGSASSPATSQPTTANPQQAVSAAWLAPGQMPFASTFTWKADQAGAQGGEVPIGQELTPTVFYVPKDTSFQALTMCADPTQLLTRTIGAQHTEYTATTTGTAASQFIFFFADASSAQQTLTWLRSQYSSSCLLNGSGAQVSKTGGDGVTSDAYLTVKGSNGPVDLSPYNREFFVLRGSTIAYVVIQSTATLSKTYDDASQISAIAAHLCVYGGSCD